MNDSLRYLGREPIYRQYHHHEMTFAMAYAYSENFILPISHDEVVHGKGSMFERVPQDEWRKFGTLRAFYAFMWAHPGQEAAVHGHRVRPAPRVLRGPQHRLGRERPLGTPRSPAADQGHERHLPEHPALWKLDTDPSGFSWIDADDRGGNVFSFLRYDGDGQMIACVTNFSSEPRPRLPDRPAGRGRLEGDPEHRRRRLRRHRPDRQPRPGRRHRGPVARLPGLGRR